jgi:gliding motility-associated-like protein
MHVTNAQHLWCLMFFLWSWSGVSGLMANTPTQGYPSAIACGGASVFCAVHTNEPPTANNDTVLMAANTTISINVLGNDVLTGILTVQAVLPGGPLHGSATVNADGSIRYTPIADYCGEDFFFYEICNIFGCDTAEVRIFIDCKSLEDVVAVNAFSPNGDGMNDFFTIRGLDQYPENRLQIYNRWGNLVFDAQDYQGNWDGTWGSRTVPDGTYFYLLTFPDRPPLKGYVQVHR